MVDNGEGSVISAVPDRLRSARRADGGLIHCIRDAAGYQAGCQTTTCGDRAATPAERSANTQTRRKAMLRMRRRSRRCLIRYRRPVDRRSRPQQWADAVQTLADLLDQFQGVARDNLRLQPSQTARRRKRLMLCCSCAGMSKSFRRSSCQRASDGTDGTHRGATEHAPAEQIALATSGAVHIRLLGSRTSRPGAARRTASPSGRWRARVPARRSSAQNLSRLRRERLPRRGGRGCNGLAGSCRVAHRSLVTRRRGTLTQGYAPTYPADWARFRHTRPSVPNSPCGRSTSNSAITA